MPPKNEAMRVERGLSIMPSSFRLSPQSAILFVWLVLCLVLGVRSFLFSASHTVYHNYANAGRSWLHGEDAYEIERDAKGTIIPRMSGYRYSPLVSAFFVPFSLLPDALGGMLWRLFSYACYLGAFVWFLREMLPTSDSVGKNAKAALWLLLIPLSLGSMNNGQANVLLMALILAAGAAAVTERWNATAFFLAGACLLKIYPLAVALLMVVVYPRRLGWRFGLALGVGLILPFALQHHGYVLEQYENWYHLLVTDDRQLFPMNEGYRDFYLLTRFVGAPMQHTAYLILQLSAAMSVAGICVLGRLRHWPVRHLIQTLLALGCCWMTVFGPSTESSTFILLAPALAWALVDAFQNDGPAWSRGALILVMAMFLATFMATWFPGGRDWLYVLQPFSALVFFLERLLSSGPRTARLASIEVRSSSQAA